MYRRGSVILIKTHIAKLINELIKYEVKLMQTKQTPSFSYCFFTEQPTPPGAMELEDLFPVVAEQGRSS